MNVQGFAGHPRPSRGAECSYPLEPLFTQSEANKGVQQREIETRECFDTYRPLPGRPLGCFKFEKFVEFFLIRVARIGNFYQKLGHVSVTAARKGKREFLEFL
jgi:hypothetical protein